MIPLLYEANETDFNKMGVPLKDTVSCLVTESRNGVYELEMTYPVGGTRLNDIRPDKIIKAHGSKKAKNQRFKIVRVTKPKNGLITVYAQHVSYLTQEVALNPSVSFNGNAQSALNAWRNNIVGDNPFSVYSDVATTSSGKWEIQDIESARHALGGREGSILDNYGGEYEFDNYDIRLWTNRGQDKNYLIAYGNNLIDLTQEEEIANTYTSVYPFAKYTDDNQVDHILTLPELYIDSEYVGNYARRKILVRDFSNEDIETVEQLRTATEKYITQNDVGIPSINLKLSFIDLTRTLDYAGNARKEINLCDWALVHLERLDIKKKVKVIKIIWNVLLDRYESLELGEARSNLIQRIDQTINNRLETVAKEIQTVQMAANGKNKVYRGTVEPAEGMNLNDIWYQPVGAGETMMYVFDGAYWQLNKVSAGLLGGILDAENGDVNLINVNVANIVGETSNFVQSWWNGITDTVNIANGALTTYSNTDGSRTRLTSGLLEVWNDTNNKTGAIGVGYNVSDPSVTGIAVNLEYGKEFSVRRKINYGDSAFSEAFGINWNLSQFSMRMNMSMHDNDILAIGRLALKDGIDMGYSRLRQTEAVQFGNSGTVTGVIQPINQSNIGVFSSGYLALGIGNNSAGTTEIARISDAEVRLFRNLNLGDNAVNRVRQISFRNETNPTGNIVNVTGTNDIGLYSSGSLYLGVNGGDNYASNVRIQRSVVNLTVDLDMGGKSILNQSDIRLKTNVIDSDLEALKEIERMKFIEYDWDLTNPANKDKTEGRNFGIVAQYSPFLQTKAGEVDSYLSVDMTKQVNLNSKAIQELLNRIKVLEAKI